MPVTDSLQFNHTRIQLGRPKPLRDALAAAAIVLSAGIAAVCMSWMETRHLLKEGIVAKLGFLASSIASQIDGDLHETLRSGEQTDSSEYNRCIEPLRRAHKVLPQLKFVYTMVPDGKTVRFVLDTSESGNTNQDGIEDRSSVWDEYTEASSKITALLAHPPALGTAIAEPVVDRWGTWVSGYAPVRTADGRITAVLGIDIDAAGFLARLDKADRSAMAGLAPCLLVSIFVGGFVFYLRRGEGLGMVAVERARQEAEKSSRVKSAFLANMSHEIRTPITAVLGYADLMRDETISTSERLSHAATIHRAGSHLLQLINDILDISRIEAQKMTLEPGRFSPAKVLDEVTELLHGKAITKDVTLSCSWNGEPPAEVIGDAMRYRQVLVNIVGNAIKFTPSGRVTVVASCRTEPCARLVITAAITDTGIGMSGPELARLFKPFSQADASTTRKFGGSGLGLIIARQLAVMMGGDIAVTSSPGIGSRFEVSVRFDAACEIAGNPTPDRPNLPNPQPAAPILGRDVKAARILLAEDTPDNQRLIAHYLKDECAELVIVSDGQAAVDAATRRWVDSGPKSGLAHPFDVLLMDMQMPVMDGYTAVAALRAAGYPGVIVAFTAHAMSGDADKCRASGCDDHLSKPVSRADLLACLRRHIKSSPEADRARTGTSEAVSTLPAAKL